MGARFASTFQRLSDLTLLLLESTVAVSAKTTGTVEALVDQAPGAPLLLEGVGVAGHHHHLVTQVAGAVDMAATHHLLTGGARHRRLAEAMAPTTTATATNDPNVVDTEVDTGLRVLMTGGEGRLLPDEAAVTLAHRFAPEDTVMTLALLPVDETAGPLLLVVATMIRRVDIRMGLGFRSRAFSSFTLPSLSESSSHP